MAYPQLRCKPSALGDVVPPSGSSSRGFDECLSQIADPALETEVHDWVMDGLNRLPDERALALQLFHMGHSLVEIAKMTGTPVGTVKARMFHGRRKLRRHLSDSDHRVRRPACGA